MDIRLKIRNYFLTEEIQIPATEYVAFKLSTDLRNEMKVDSDEEV